MSLGVSLVLRYSILVKNPLFKKHVTPQQINHDGSSVCKTNTSNHMIYALMQWGKKPTYNVKSIGMKVHGSKIPVYCLAEASKLEFIMTNDLNEKQETPTVKYT